MQRRGSAAGNALAFAVELHRAPADGEVSGRLELLDERRRARSRPQLSAFRHGLVRMREDHRCGPHELVHRMRAGNEDSRVRSEIEHGEVCLVELVHDRFHLGMDAGVAREVGGQSVGELDDEAGGGAVFEDGAVRLQGSRCASESSAGGALFTCEA